MKKRNFRMIVAACLLVLAMGLTACGNDGKFASMKDYVESEEAQSAMAEFSGQDGMEITLTADGDKMVYTYKFTQMENQDGMSELLEAGVEAQADVFYDMAEQLKDIVNVKKPVVTVTYIDMNNKVIYTRDFEAK